MPGDRDDARPARSVDAEGVGAAGGTAGVASTTADSSGNWSLSLPVGLRHDHDHGHRHAGRQTVYSQLSVANSALPGPTVLSVTDPSGDDNGPGTYAYPTAPAFQPVRSTCSR